MFPENIERLNHPVDDFKLNFSKDSFFDDEKLLTKGVIKVIIEEDDEYKTIIKEFVSHDGTFTRKSMITMSNEEFDNQITKNVNNEKVLKQIEDLRSRIETEASAQNYEECAKLKTQIQTLTRFLK